MTQARPALSNRAYNILTYIRTYSEQHGWAPTLREIAKAVDLNSTSAVAYQLNVLEARGYIQRGDFTPRAIRVV